MAEIDLEEEKKELLRRYRKLLRHAKPFLKKDDAKVIKKAFNVAVEAHDGMRRKSGEPYIYHPIEVAQICVEEIGLGPTSIISALLHDVVEDTEWEIKDIEKEFGVKVARIIEGLTKISGVFEYGTSAQAENFRKMLLTLSDDVRVILIKIADRLHNMRTLESMPRNKQLKIASETNYLYAPLAHRLGLYAIKSELEDLYLKYTDTEVYYDIARRLKKNKEVQERFIRKFINPIQKSIENLGYKVEIKGRPKSINSILQKMKKQNIPFEEVYDIFAVRIILDVPQEHEKAASWQVYSIVTDFYQPNPDRLRDWISTPKANGYESLHTTVMSKTGKWVEVQIRTKRMDEIAEKGYAAHWKYKGDETKQKNRLDDWISQVRNMLDNADESAFDFMDEFRPNLFRQEVFAFTPKGELIVMPSGATTLDFAFNIHTQVGNKCIGAKVNHKLEPLSYELQNGDQVEILTSEKQKANRDWLQFVITSRAKTKIKSLLKEEKRQLAREGKEIVRRKFKQMRITESHESVKDILKHFSLPNIQELYYRVGDGLLDPKEIKDFKKKLKDKNKKRGKKKIGLIEDAKSFEREVKKIRGVDSDMLLIGEDMDKIDYQIAACCNPIPGDDVFGFVTVGEGIKIHRTNCPNAIDLMSNFGYRILKAKWTSQQQIAFLAGVKVKGSDRLGIVSDLTLLISNNHKVNMRSITIDSHDGVFEGTIMLFVDDAKHLEILIKTIEKVKGIISVERFDS